MTIAWCRGKASSAGELIAILSSTFSIALRIFLDGICEPVRIDVFQVPMVMIGL
jgi:hypothetical protein